MGCQRIDCLLLSTGTVHEGFFGALRLAVLSLARMPWESSRTWKL